MRTEGAVAAATKEEKAAEAALVATKEVDEAAAEDRKNLPQLTGATGAAVISCAGV
jgi:hypothetical protein